jgi:hypothetical protein
MEGGELSSQYDEDDEERNKKLEDAPTVDPKSQNATLQEAFAVAEKYHREFHDCQFRKEVLRSAIESE